MCERDRETHPIPVGVAIRSLELVEVPGASDPSLVRESGSRQVASEVLGLGRLRRVLLWRGGERSVWRERGRERAWGETGAGGQFQELMCVPRRGEARGGGIRRGRGNVSLTFPRAFSPARVPPVERGEGFLSCARGKLRARQSFGSRERARVRARGRLESIGEWIGC